MTHSRWRIFKIIGAVLGALLVVALVVGILVARSQWFRNFAREQIIATVERSTGGRVEINAFRFDWTRLHAEIDNFVLHGTEPAGAAPLFRARLLTVDLKLLSLFRKKIVDIAGVDVIEPQANIIVLADGNTNVPSPNIKQPSDKTALQTIVDLAIGRFTIVNGLAVVSERKLNFSGRGENLRAQLNYQMLPARYTGTLSLSPLIVQSAQNPPLPVTVNLPVVIEGDKVRLEKAVLSTANSRVELTGQLEHLTDPWVSAKASSKIDLPEIERTLGLAVSPRGTPQVLTADVDFATDEKGVRISSAKAVLGKSTIDAEGAFKNIVFDSGEVNFRSNLALDELSRIANAGVVASGSAQLNGKATINSRTDYRADATLDAKNINVKRDAVQIRNAFVTSQIVADPRQIRLDGFRIGLAAGELTGDAALEELAIYRVDGRLSRFDISDTLQAVTGRKVGYGGAVSGTIGANGNLKQPGTSSLIARAKLNIEPNRKGVPVRGVLNVSYDGRRDVVDVGQSNITLPSSRLDLSGSLGQQIAVRLNSRDLNDFLPAMAAASEQPPQPIPVHFLPGGAANVDATVRGKMTSPLVAGHVSLTKFEASGRPFDSASADINASPNQVLAQNAVVTRGTLRMDLQASLGLANWKTTNASPLQAAATVRNADVVDVLALAGQSNVPVRGALSLTAQATGTLGDPRGNADVSIVSGEAYGEAVDRLTARITAAGRRVDIPTLDLVSGMARLQANASFEHPQGSFDTGTLRAHVNGNQIALARLKNVTQRMPDADGNLQLNADVEAQLLPPNSDPRVQLTAVDGTVTARNLQMQGRQLGELNAKVSTQGKQMTFDADSNFAGSSIRAQGQTTLDGVYSTTADLDIRNLPVEQVLLVANRRDLDIKGTFGMRGRVSGTLREPAATADLDLTRATYRTQPIDRLQGHIEYGSTRVAVSGMELAAGPNRVTLTASFDHPQNDFTNGRFSVKAESNSVQMRDLKLLDEIRPGLSGVAQLTVDAAGQLNKPSASPRIALSSLEGSVKANSVQLNGRNFGDVSATAERGGNGVQLRVDSTLAQSEIKGSGEVQLTANYPVKGDLTFTNVRYSNWAALLNRNSIGTGPAADGLLEGRVQVSGPAAQLDALTGRLELSRVEVVTTSRTNLNGPQQALTLRNEGAVVAVVNQAKVEIQQAHLTGPKTDVVVTGGATLRPSLALDVNINSNVDLALLHQFDNDISSEGAIALNAAIKGPATEPDIRGRLTLKDAAFQMGSIPNGLSKANGTIVFNGDIASIESFTGESGGGPIRLSGTVSRRGSLFQYNLDARATRVRVRTQQGVSAVANATLALTGTSENSLLAGRVTLQSVGFTSRTDIGSVLTQASAPAETPAAPQGFIAGMRLNVSIRLAPGAIVQTALAENLEAEADLTLRGTLANPGMLGRVQLNEGQFVFFGSKYKVNEGSVAFFNPNKIEPVLNLNLETTARGVAVTLAVSGPIQNMTLAYQSDPPLPFDEIVGLLAAGQVPTSDPVLVARQPPAPQQSFQQMGASAVMSTAVTNPVSGQLQRVFGVSQLKIDPTFTSGSELPQARLTLQQQVTTNLTFTYVTNLTRSNPQIIRVEWAFDKNWSAIASRQENGLVALDLFYKRRIH